MRCLKYLIFTMVLSIAVLGRFDRSCLAQTIQGSKLESRLPKESASDEWEVVWDELGGFDDARVTRAIWTLIASPERTVKLLEERLHPVSEADQEKVVAWIADLDSSRFVIRDRAEQELRKLGEAAAPALRAALEKPPSAEVRDRAERILARAVDKKTTPDRIRSGRAIAVLERIGSKESLRVLERLSEGSAQARETQLARKAAARLKRRLEPSEAPSESTTLNAR